MHMDINLIVIVVPRDNQLMLARGTIAKQKNLVV